MKIFCPNCNIQFTKTNINVMENICVCTICNEIFNLSEMVDHDKYNEAEKLLKSPPKGINLKNEHNKIFIKISVCSKKAIFLFLFTICFSSVSFLGFYQAVIAKSIIGFSLMLIFIVASIYLWIQVFFSIFGKITLSFDKYEHNNIFVGVGKIGKKNIINWASIRNIYEHTDYYSEGGLSKKIHINIENRIVRIPIDYINDEKIRFLFLVLAYFKYKMEK